MTKFVIEAHFTSEEYETVTFEVEAEDSFAAEEAAWEVVDKHSPGYGFTATDLDVIDEIESEDD